MVKVTELIKSKSQFSYSVEVTPDVSEEEIDKLDMEPTFFSVTWHAKSHKCKDLEIGPLRLARILRTKQKHVLLHMTCDMMTEKYLTELLNVLQEIDICNLFLVLGESYDPKTSDFENTSQLITFIRKQTGNYFCIGVAGFPSCNDEKILHLKQKIESGANYIITQAFFDVNTFNDFKRSCENANIHVPLIPGVFPFETYKQLQGFTNLCKVKVSSDFLQYVSRDDVDKIGVDLIKQLMKQLKDECNITHFHFFTLNKLHCKNKQIYVIDFSFLLSRPH